MNRLRGRLWPILQTALAATTAWYAAVLLLPDGRPSFASIAAVICLGASYGQRGSKALQLIAGVVLGICVASVLVALIGTGLAADRPDGRAGDERRRAAARRRAAGRRVGGLGDPAGLAGPEHERRLVHAQPRAGRADRRRRRLGGDVAGLPARSGAARRPRGAGRVLRARRGARAAVGGAGRERRGRGRRGAGRGAGAGRAGRRVRRGAADRPRDRVAVAPPARPCWPTSTATARASPRSTSPSATRACSRATRCGWRGRASRSTRRCRRPCASSASASGRSRAPTSSPSAPTPSAATRCAPARWRARRAAARSRPRSARPPSTCAAPPTCSASEPLEAPTEELLAAVAGLRRAMVRRSCGSRRLVRCW